MQRLEGQHLVLGDAFGAFEVVASDLEGIGVFAAAAEDLVGRCGFLDLAGIDRRKQGVDLTLIKHAGLQKVVCSQPFGRERTTPPTDRPPHARSIGASGRFS